MPSVSLAELQNRVKTPIESALEQSDPEHIRLDLEQVFLIFATLCGDAEATAASIGVPAKLIASLAESEGWNEKLAPIIAKKKSKRPGDVERAINRALNFTMAHRYRNFLERVLRKLMLWDDQQIDDFLIATEQQKSGDTKVKFQSRALADFAVALQKCQEMSYMALNDSTPERSKRGESVDSDEVSLSALHAQLARGMAEAGEPKTGVGGLVASQVDRLQAENAVKVLPETPYNKGD